MLASKSTKLETLLKRNLKIHDWNAKDCSTSISIPADIQRVKLDNDHLVIWLLSN